MPYLTGPADFTEKYPVVGVSTVVVSGGNTIGEFGNPDDLGMTGPVLILFYLTQYFLVIPIVIGGIAFAVWRKRK